MPKLVCQTPLALDPPMVGTDPSNRIRRCGTVGPAPSEPPSTHGQVPYAGVWGDGPAGPLSNRSNNFRMSLVFWLVGTHVPKGAGGGGLGQLERGGLERLLIADPLIGGPLFGGP